jgi:hypothetical protein
VALAPVAASPAAPVKAALPALALRTTRVRLLASSWEDAMTSGTLDGGGPDKPGSRMNLHDDLWTYGSYDELGRLVTHAASEFRKAYLGVAFRYHPPRDLDALVLLTRRMPACIYVPAEVSENAGYLPGEAGAWRMPEGEQQRRWARRPVRS